MRKNKSEDEAFNALVLGTFFCAAIIWITITGRLPNPGRHYRNYQQPIQMDGSKSP